MKIMIVTPYFYPKVGGLHNYALKIAKGLKEQGHDVFVVTSNHVTKNYVDEKVQGLRVIRLPITFKFSNTPLNPLWYWQLKKIIKAEKPDLINAHTPVPGIADMAIYAAGRIPTALTYHAGSLRKDGSLIFNVVARIYEIIQIPILKRATSIIAVSDYVKECLPNKYQAKVTVIYNAINPSEIPKQKVTRRQNRLIFVGTLDRSHSWKGLSDILKAVQIVKKTNSKTELLVLGDGNMRSKYERQVEQLDLSDNVVFCGYVNATEKYKLIQSASAILAYPTTANDAFPTIFPEAWACGTPIIASDIGALTSLLKTTDAGELVKPHDPFTLAKSVESLLLDKDRVKTLVANGHRLIAQQINWKVSCQDTSKLFSDIIKPKVCIIHNMVTPYRLPVFEELSKKVNLTVLFCKAISNDRVWTYDLEKYSFKYTVLKGFNVGPITFNTNALSQLVKSDFDIVITSSDPDSAPITLLSLLLAKLRRRKIIIWSEVIDQNIYIFPALANSDLPLYNALRSILTWLVMRYRKLCFYSSDYFLAFSKKARKFLIDYKIDPKKISLTFQVLPKSTLVQPSYNIKRNSKSILYLGYLSQQKGVNYLIDAFKQLEGMDMELTIAGVGPAENMLKSQAAEDKRIKFAGYVEGRSKANLYARSSIFVLPTLNDCWGLVINEAMYYGLSVICSDAAGASELLDKNIDQIFPAKNSSQLKDALDNMLKNIKGITYPASRSSLPTDLNKTIEGFLSAIWGV